MKCPKCGYIGFESAQKCRNCGYDFSLASEPVREIDLPLTRDEPLGAPADFDFRTGDTPRAMPVRRRGSASGDFDLPARTPRAIEPDLPLFGAASPVPSSQAASPAAVPGRAAGTPLPVVRPAATPVRPAGPSLRPRARAAAFDFTDPSPVLDPASVAPRGPFAGTPPDGRPAGSVARAIAGLLDAAIMIGLDAGVLYFTLRVCRLSFSEIAILPPAPLVAFWLLLDGAYLVAFTAFGGQTIGKMAAGLKVVGEDGTRVIPGQALVRAFGYIASLIPAGLGFVPRGPSRRALHDRLAHTRVVQA
jgi:uncharacterized RDD family membrane protein YckC